MIHVRELLIDLKTNIAWLIITEQLYCGQNKSLKRAAETKWPQQLYGGVLLLFGGYFEDLVNRGVLLA